MTPIVLNRNLKCIKTPISMILYSFCNSIFILNPKKNFRKIEDFFYDINIFKVFDPLKLNPRVTPAKSHMFFFELIKKETDVSEIPIYRLIQPSLI